jgi:hypothetical protein
MAAKVKKTAKRKTNLAKSRAVCQGFGRDTGARGFFFDLANRQQPPSIPPVTSGSGWLGLYSGVSRHFDGTALDTAPIYAGFAGV